MQVQKCNYFFYFIEVHLLSNFILISSPFFWPHHEACGILVPDQESMPLVLEGTVLTTGLSGKSLTISLLLSQLMTRIKLSEYT